MMSGANVEANSLNDRSRTKNEAGVMV
eukprot:COSAG02_NODE_3592_length_6515_cov_5.044576_9_plen_26_part_01